MDATVGEFESDIEDSDLPRLDDYGFKLPYVEACIMELLKCLTSQCGTISCYIGFNIKK